VPCTHPSSSFGRGCRAFGRGHPTAVLYSRRWRPCSFCSPPRWRGGDGRRREDGRGHSSTGAHLGGRSPCCHGWRGFSLPNAGNEELVADAAEADAAATAWGSTSLLCWVRGRHRCWWRLLLLLLRWARLGLYVRAAGTRERRMNIPYSRRNIWQRKITSKVIPFLAFRIPALLQTMVG
jgi:hypothetical protein